MRRTVRGSPDALSLDRSEVLWEALHDGVVRGDVTPAGSHDAGAGVLVVVAKAFDAHERADPAGTNHFQEVTGVNKRRLVLHPPRVSHPPRRALSAEALAIEDVAAHPFGRFLLIALALGFAAYALQRN
jgi:hypothetical protein